MTYYKIFNLLPDFKIILKLGLILQLSIFFIHECFGITYDDIWWIGGSESTAAGNIRIIYTYPDEVYTNQNFSVGITLEYIHDLDPRSNWVSFSNVSVILNNGIQNKTYSNEDNSPLLVIKPGDVYTENIELKAPNRPGKYILGIKFNTFFGPGGSLWSYQWNALDYYNATWRDHGIIYPNESPPLNVLGKNHQKYNQLKVELQKPYGQFTNITITLKNNTESTNTETIPITINENDVSLSLRHNTTYTLTIPEVIDIVDNEFRGSFIKWSDGYESNKRNITMDKSVEFYALYKPVYYLNVISDLGGTKGSNWYPSNTIASFSVEPLSGIFLLKSFDHWIGDAITTGINIPSGFVTMNGPKSIHAVWEYDLNYLGIYFGAIGTAITIAGLTKRFWKRKKKSYE